jgi:hypothetical protein
MKRISTLAVSLLAAGVVVAAAATNWPSSPYASVSRIVLADVVVIALAIVAIVLGAHADRLRAPSWVLWIACGALIGAAAAGPVGLALWVVPAVLAIGAAGVFAGLRGLGGVLRRLAVALTALIVNFTFLWSATTAGAPRLTPAEFQARDFRVNTFLADVPLHDVWVFHLAGGDEGLTLREARRVLVQASPLDANTAVAVLVGFRMFFGGLLGLDDEKYFDQGSSYKNRLTEEDSLRTLERPSGEGGLFHTVYAFENEELAEMMNRTAHAFFCMAIEPADDGYTMYWAIYVKETGGLTPIYMSLIDPFRRYIVYPAAVESVERTWARRWND